MAALNNIGVHKACIVFIEHIIKAGHAGIFHRTFEYHWQEILMPY